MTFYSTISEKFKNLRKEFEEKIYDAVEKANNEPSPSNFVTVAKVCEAYGNLLLNAESFEQGDTA